jgi:hypothetical protein
MYNRISRFGPDGVFAGFVGAAGQGPGEYDAVVALAVTPSGTLMAQLYEGRIISYSHDGEYLAEWRSDRRLAQDRSLTPIHDSLLVLKVVVPDADRASPLRHRFLRMTEAGVVVDSFPDLSTPWDDEVVWGPSDIVPSRTSLWSPADFGIAVVGSRLAYQTASPNGEVLRVERAFEPVAFLPEERTDWEAQNELLRQRAGDPTRFPPVPGHKPVVRGVFTPPSGEVWVQVSTPSVGPDPGHVAVVAGLRATPEWLEPLRMEVFTASGAYLGTVVGPAGIDVRAVSDGVIWGYRNGTLGEQHIVRLRVDGLQ